MKIGYAKKSLIAATLLALLPSGALAFYGGERGSKGLPPEAYSACEGKKAGDQVVFKNRRGETVKAVCTEFEGRLLALPPRDPGKGKEGGHYRKEGRMDNSRRLARMTATLGLSEDQQTRIRSILDSEKRDTDPIREKMAANRTKLRQEIHSTGDEGAIRHLTAEAASLKGDLLVFRAKSVKEIREVLTPEQADKAEQWNKTAGRGQRGRCTL